MLSQDVDAAGVHPASGQDAHALAEQIVRQQQPVINRFVAKQRQQIEIGGAAKDVHNAFLPLDNMDVYYSHVQGLERMHYPISPEAEAPQPLPEIPIPEELKVPEISKLPEVPELEVPEVPELEIPETPEVS